MAPPSDSSVADLRCCWVGDSGGDDNGGDMMSTMTSFLSLLGMRSPRTSPAPAEGACQ